MTRHHRNIHRLFWLLAAPAFIALIMVNMPDGENSTPGKNVIPDAGKGAVFASIEKPASESAQ